MIYPSSISLDATDRVGERSRSRSVAAGYPTPMNSMSPMALLWRAATRVMAFIEFINLQFKISWRLPEF
jgi:hypothetical protein